MRGARILTGLVCLALVYFAVKHLVAGDYLNVLVDIVICVYAAKFVAAH